MSQPKKWKFAFLIWIFIFPLISLLSLLLNPFLYDVNLLVRNFIMTLILVPIMAWFYIPYVNKKYYNWLRK